MNDVPQTDSNWVLPRSFSDVLLVGFIFWFGSYTYSVVYQVVPFKPLYSYFLLIAFALFYIFRRAGVGLGVSGTGDVRFRAFLLWLCAYFVYSTLAFAGAVQDSETIARFILHGEAIVLMGGFAILMATPRRLRMTMGMMAILAIVASVLCAVDFVHPMFTKVTGRGAGFYENPNLAGRFIALAMVAGILAIPTRLRPWFLVFCGFGVLATFSRSAYILWGISTVGMAWYGYFGSARTRMAVSIGILLIGGGGAVLLVTGALGSIVQNSPVSSYLTQDTKMRIGIGSQVLSGRSASEREALVRDSLESAASAPWVGHGLGYTRKWAYGKPPHNEYLLFLVEGGVLGLAFFLSVLALMWFAGSGVGRIVTIQLILGAVFAHTQFTEPASMIFFSFVFAYGAVRTMTRGIYSHAPLPAGA